jgi:hypothetical protein
MKLRIGTLAVLVAMTACVPAVAAPIQVNVRVETPTRTIFDGKVTTDTQAPLTKDDTGAHPCDGTNGGANPTPGPTVTGALNDASKLGGFDWTASWSNSFNDFFINSIGSTDTTGDQFWEAIVNFKPTSAGGCQIEVHSGDQVLWAVGGGTHAKHILKLTAPTHAKAGKPFTVKVVDGKNGAVIKGAKVGGQKTDRKGRAKLRFSKTGVKKLKATRTDSIRSNQVQVTIGK